jgi:putative glutamine amidotransferase
MSETPIIVVPADVKEVDGYRWHAAAEPYLKAIVTGFGGLPLILPSLADGLDIDALLDRIDGVLLPGSRSNVHPARYGEKPDPTSEPYDTARDASSFALSAAALRKGVPLFAICRGMQELNVALGGTLISELQEVEGRHDHRAPVSDEQAERFAIRQDVDIAAEGELARVLGAGTVRVNSLHRQGIGTLAPGLAIEATAPDGTIEAVRVIGAPGFAIGVQWHPEYWVESDEPSARLFAAFGQAVRARMAKRRPILAAAE